MKALLALLGKPAGKSMGASKGAPADESDGDDGEGSSARTYAREAFSAIKDGDEDGFVAAFLGAVRSCSKKEEAAEGETEGDDSGGYDAA